VFENIFAIFLTNSRERYPVLCIGFVTIKSIKHYDDNNFTEILREITIFRKEISRRLHHFSKESLALIAIYLTLKIK
jgi:hypothetical protein